VRPFHPRKGRRTRKAKSGGKKGEKGRKFSLVGDSDWIQKGEAEDRRRKVLGHRLRRLQPWGIARGKGGKGKARRPPGARGGGRKKREGTAVISSETRSVGERRKKRTTREGKGEECPLFYFFPSLEGGKRKPGAASGWLKGEKHRLYSHITS